jgi:hypothetical protein
VFSAVAGRFDIAGEAASQTEIDGGAIFGQMLIPRPVKPGKINPRVSIKGPSLVRRL